MFPTWWVRRVVLPAAALLLAAGLGSAQDIQVGDWAGGERPPKGFPFPPRLHGNLPDYYLHPLPPEAYGPGWYWYNVHWPAVDGYFTYMLPEGGYRVFYPMGRGRSYLVYLAELGLERPDLSAHERPSNYAYPRDQLRRLNPEENPTLAVVLVRLPLPTAEVYINDQKVGGRGPTRRYVTPPLDKAKTYHYDVTVRWIQDGRFVSQTKRVPIRAGARETVDFGRPRQY
ncbi:MAG TPA: TIGR03000 domain-containing protein [Gemmataceae bacterium]|nr:TIGR03000 domain-containing protein [Gemmataceae bacterium]